MRVIHYILYITVLLTSCSSSSVMEEVKDITQSNDPIRFRDVSGDYQVTRTDASIPNLLKQNFMVSCYKNFAKELQQTVMPMYEVNYETYNSQYGEVSWNYIPTPNGHQFYQEQFERYWDFSAFPYHFFAVSPAPLQSGALISGFNLTDKELLIPMRYEYQTCTDGQTTAGAEPCLVAEVERRTTGRDYDLLVKAADNTYPKEINTGSQTLNRIVALPFHHLNCKVRFCIYCPNLGEGGELHEVTNVKIKVRSADFLTSATYKANMDEDGTLMGGSFTSPTTASTPEEAVLLTISDAYRTQQTGNNLYYDTTLGHQMVKYYFECPNGMWQIPQEGVQLSITFTVEGRFDETTYDPSKVNIEYDGGFTTFTDVPIALKDPYQDTFTWEKNTYYTYNIILGPFIPAESTYPVGGDGKTEPIWFTCVVGEWENVESDVIGSGQEDW